MPSPRIFEEATSSAQDFKIRLDMPTSSSSYEEHTTAVTRRRHRVVMRRSCARLQVPHHRHRRRQCALRGVRSPLSKRKLTIVEGVMAPRHVVISRNEDAKAIGEDTKVA